MTMIAESPFLVAIILVVVGGGLLFAWLNTGNKIAAAAGGVALLLIPAAFAIAANIETDAEAIRRVIDATAAAVRDNEHDAVLAIIGDERTRTQAAAELPRYRFDEARVTGIRSIDVIDEAVPKAAEVDLNVKVTVSEVRGSLQNISVPRRVLLTFEKQPPAGGGEARWVVTAYSHLPIVGDPDAYSTGVGGR